MLTPLDKVLTKLAAQVRQLVAFSQIVQPSKLQTTKVQVADDPVPDLVKPYGQVQEKSEPLCVLIKLAPQVAQLVEFSQIVQPSQMQEGEQNAAGPVPDLVKLGVGH
jgi:hypothetical protein